MAYKHGELTEEIISAFYHVYHTLGYGFLERVYENALAIELRKRGHVVTQQAPITIMYSGQPVGEYYADILVDGLVIVEMKALDGIVPEHQAQLLNYLRGSNIDVGLLLNAGPKPEIKRKIYDTARLKTHAAQGAQV